MKKFEKKLTDAELDIVNGGVSSARYQNFLSPENGAADMGNMQNNIDKTGTFQAPGQSGQVIKNTRGENWI